MLRIEKVLYPTDFTRCAGQALTHALYLADAYRAELHMLHAIVLHEDDPHNPSHHFPDAKVVYEKLKEIANVRMKSVIDDLTVRELKIKRTQERGVAPGPVILDYAGEHDVDLIVMGTHGRRALGHMVLGSVAEEVVRFSKCPVLTVREQKKPKPIEAIEKVLVPIDFSDHAGKALSHAKVIAKRYEAKLHLLHVVEAIPNPYFYVGDHHSLYDLIPDIEEKSSLHMKKLFADTPGPEVPFEVSVIGGRATSDIVTFAKDEGTDLIVIATHGLTGLAHLFLGSVAERVVRRAPCPVLTVKPFGKSLVEA